MSTEKRLLGVYLHVPFCEHHCAYCDFNTYTAAIENSIVSQTVDAICEDLIVSAPVISPNYTVRSIFFGGGTPTFLTSTQLTKLINTIRNFYNVDENAEISTESNPATVDSTRFKDLILAGFNRLSIGVQSLDNAILKSLDRQHTAQEAINALYAAREAGFTNINLDLMYRLPNQTTELWRESIQKALDLQPEHLSLYSLTLEPGTRFERMHKGGNLPLPDEDEEIEMMEYAITRLKMCGYDHYEVSNFARSGFRCVHNQIYWNNEEYLGVGPGAVSYLNGRRWKRERLPSRYVSKILHNQDLTVEEETLSNLRTLGETIILGLRLLDGISLERLKVRFNLDPMEIYSPVIQSGIEQNLLTFNGNTLSFTHAGLLIADTISEQFLLSD